MSSDLTSIYSQRNLNALNSGNHLTYEFERFRLDAERRMLYENNHPLQLAPKVVETLVALVRQRGEIISKENLMSEVWANSFVEDSNLTQNIYLLRKTLGKGADGRDLIETFRRRGYRFTGEIKANQSSLERIGETRKTDFLAEDFRFGEIHPSRETVEAALTNGSSGGEVKPPNSVGGKRLAAFAAVAGLLALAVFAAPRFFNSNVAPTNQTSVNAPQNLKSTRLTPDINAESASFTPDGKYLVYKMQEKGKESVWLKDLTTGAATQIQPPSDRGYLNPTISRDNYLYFTSRRENSPNRTLVRVPLGGGGEQIIAADLTSPFALSPDEKQIAFVNGKYQLMIAATDGGEPRLLAERDPSDGWYESWNSRLSWSPDGASVVICGVRKRENARPLQELIEVGASDGAEKIIPTPENWRDLEDAVWLGDKSGLIVAARESETAPFQIWRVAYPNGDATRVTNDTNDYQDLAVAPDSRRLVVINSIGNLNLWVAPLDEIGKARQITFSNAANNGYWGMTFAPNDKIIYTSPRGGNFDLWQTDSEGNTSGEEQKQLTSKAGDWNGRPQMTADGRYIVFSSTRSGSTQIWRMDADGGNLKQLTNEEFADEATLSATGDAIYFTVKAGDNGQIYKTSIDGGAATQITKPPLVFFLPAVSPDGKFIFCSINDQSSNAPWKSALLNAEKGEVLKTFDFIFAAAHWTADSKSVIYSFKNENLWRIAVAGNTLPQPITNFDSGKIRTFDVSPDYKKIAFSRGSWSNEAVLLENF